MKKIVNTIGRMRLQMFAIMAILVIASCSEDEDFSPVIEQIMRGDVVANEALPEEVVFVDGTGLSGLSSITFLAMEDGAEPVDVVFNPGLNSDITIMFNVPFDEEQGSRLGAQVITFTNSAGETYTADFTILQPEPIVRRVSQSVVKVGDLVSVTGEWFHNLDSVLLGDTPMKIISSNSTSALVEVPEVNQGGAITVVTAAGRITSNTRLEIDLGVYVYVSDFDGNGTHPDGTDGNQWWTWGDLTSGGAGDSDPFEANYYEYKWDGQMNEGYLGGSTNTNSRWLTETNADKVVLELFANTVGTGATVEIILQDANNQHWQYIHTSDENDWKLLSINLSDFDSRESPGQGLKVQPDLIHRVGFEFNEGLNTGFSAESPMMFRIDNIRFLVKY